MLASFDTVYRPPWERELPDDLARVNQTILTNIQKEFDYGFKIPFKANLLSCTPTRKSIELVYNVPLKNHSSLIKVSHDRATGKTSVTVDILGHNLGDRMGATLDLANMVGLVSMGKPLKTTGYDRATERLSFTWDFSQEDLQPEDLEKLTSVIIAAYEKTLIGMFGGGDIDWEGIDGANPEFYSRFLRSSEDFAALCALGMKTYPAFGEELIAIFQRLDALGLQDQFCSMFGLEFKTIEGHSSDRLAHTFSTMMVSGSDLPPQLKNSLAMQSVLATMLKYAYNRTSSASVKKLLLDHKEKLTVPIPAAKEYSVLVGQMRYLVIEQMIHSPEFTEEDIQKYILLFGQEGQEECWKGTLQLLDALARYFRPKEQSDLLKLNKAHEALRRVAA